MAIAAGTVNIPRLNIMDPDFQRPQSVLARGVQITEFRESRINPEPIILEDTDIILEQYLSPRRLQLLTGTENLDEVTSLEMKVNTVETSLGNFGSLLPNLAELKLSNSEINCIRDLGSSLRNLRVLWMARCCLVELDGLSSMCNLKELYLAYNELRDISPCSMLDEIEVLDLEGNNLDDITQVTCLAFCSNLSNLTLEGNPLCVMSSPDSQETNYDYREAVKSILGNLKLLDDEPLAFESSKKPNVFDDDWAFLEELQNDISLQVSLSTVDAIDTDSPSPLGGTARPSTGYRPGSALRPSTGMRPASALKRPMTSAVRPDSANRPSSRDNRPDSGGFFSEEDASDLTIGTVICGNPSKALRARRKHGTAPEKETEAKLFIQFQHRPEHTYDPLPDQTDDDRTETLSELKVWRKEHEKRIEQIQASRAPQVLKIEAGETFGLSDDEIRNSDDDDELDEQLMGLSLQQQTRTNEDSVSSHSNSPDVADVRPKHFDVRQRRYKLQAKESNTNSERETKTKNRFQHDESFDCDLNTSVDQGTSSSYYSNGPDVTAGTSGMTPKAPSSHQSPTHRFIKQQPPSSKDTTIPVLHSPVHSAEAIQIPQRPATSRAALGIPVQQKMRRQLPQVPNSSSKPQFSK